jgi:AcrR family transcriptional regulator
MNDTRERILDAAERRFANHGFEATSLRAVLADANANLAAVHYYFGSKEELLRAVITRVVEPANNERLRLLAEAEQLATPDPPELEAILDAFVGPDLRLIRDLGPRGGIITRFLGRSQTEPSAVVQNLIRHQYAELGARFLAAFSRALPNVPTDELQFRLHAVVAVITHLMADPGGIGLLAPERLAESQQRLIAFAAAGFRAPTTNGEHP